MIDTELGVGSRVNTLLNQYDNYENIEGLKFLKSNRPNAIICPPLLPCEDGYLPLQLVVHDHGNNTEELIFQKSNAGNLARGRYIGDKFYSVPAVPISSQWFTLALLGLLVIGCAFTFLNRKNASGEPS